MKTSSSVALNYYKESASLLFQIYMIDKARKFCEYLEQIGVKYDICIKHKEVGGCDESKRYYERFKEFLPDDFVICKNLLIHERKGEKRTYLLITDSNKKIDFNSLKEVLESKKLEFSSDLEMKNLINTTKGNVSIFNILADYQNKVHLIIDEDLLKASSLAFHPLYNGMSIFLSPSECMKFLKLNKKEASIVSLSSKEDKQLVKKY